MTLVESGVPDLRCVVVGDDCVGKTSMLMGYATARYPTQHVPQVFDNYAGSLKVSGRRLKLQIIDTVDGDVMRSRADLYPTSDIFVVCFSVIQPDSFSNAIAFWIPEIRTLAPHAPFILVGTQADLREVPEVVSLLSHDQQQPISTEQGQEVALRMGAALYLETSPDQEGRIHRLLDAAFRRMLGGGRGRGCSIWSVRPPTTSRDCAIL